MMKLFIEAGSEYDPGWHIYHVVRENYLVSKGTWGTRAEAEEELAHMKSYYESYGEAVEIGRMP